MTHPELWTAGVSLPGFVERAATRAEADGWDGLSVVDSQNLAGDVYVALTLAARETERVKLATGVTNPLTRHPAVTAAAIGSVHTTSGGRAVLGIGRGDSALAHVGRSPASVAQLERYLVAVQTYLRGEDLEFGDLDFHPTPAPPLEALGLAGAPERSRLHWLSPQLPKVPVEVAATGPKTIGAAARQADRVMLALGADPARVRWGIDVARTERPEVSIGAFVNVVAHDYLDAARRLISGGVATFARFAVMHGDVTGPADDAQQQVLNAVHDAYDMNRHTQVGSPQADALTSEFVDRFGIVGPVEHCVERLRELVGLGLDKLTITGPTLGADPSEARAALARLSREVLPNLRE